MDDKVLDSMYFRDAGLLMKVEQAGDAKNGTLYRWSITRHKRPIAQGFDKSEAAARDAMWAANRKLLEEMHSKNQVKSGWRLKLRSLLHRRPYLVLGICEAIYKSPLPKSQVILQADEFEQYWGKKFNFATPIPKKGLALSPEKAAEQIWDAMVGVGLIRIDSEGNIDTRKVEKWTYEMFGEYIFFPDQDPELQAMREEAKRQLAKRKKAEKAAQEVEPQPRLRAVRR